MFGVMLRLSIVQCVVGVWRGNMADREKEKCFHLVPEYYGERPASTRGEPSSKGDWYFKCYHTAEFKINDYRHSNSIIKLCNGCKKYLYIRPLTAEEIKQKYYNGKSRQVLVVNKNRWYFKEV